jgi:ferredoxin
MRQAFRSLHAASGTASPVIPMPEQAPFGLARVDTSGCTLCLACTMVCPTGAFTANPDTPQLRFLEEACVQCGLCASTCPEKVITLEPRLNLAPEASQHVVVKEEAPVECRRCAKPFGMRSSVDRVKAKLIASGHWMFQGPGRLAVLELCEDCRVVERPPAASTLCRHRAARHHHPRGLRGGPGAVAFLRGGASALPVEPARRTRRAT